MPNPIDIEEVVATFAPPEDLQTRRMRQEGDRLGKEAFFEKVDGARPASPTEVRRFLENSGFEVGAHWVEAQDLRRGRPLREHRLVDQSL